MKKTIETLRADATRRLRREYRDAAVFGVLLVVLLAATFTDTLPVGGDDGFSRAFVGGAGSGLLATALAVAVKKIVELRRALTDDRALKEEYAREHDELTAHSGRRVAEAFVNATPVIFAIVLVGAAFVDRQMLQGVATLAVVQSVVLLALKFHYKRALAGDDEE